ncbi:MAG: PKD domain-containing protein, partial [Bacteroidota bacterium]
EYFCINQTDLTLAIYDRPQARVLPGDTTICAGDSLLFTDLSLQSDFIQWTFSDGLTSTASSFSRIFSEAGDVSLTVVVGNGSGCTDTLRRTINVRPSPVADFDFFELTDELTNTFQFLDRSSSDAIIFGWDFMDVPDSDERNPVRRFVSINDQLVRHWVVNAVGCSDTASMVIDLDTLNRSYIPNAFEPENFSIPGKNSFHPKGIGLAEFHIAVYARNGQLVWESTSIDENGSPDEAWDGFFRGKLLGPDVFTWYVRLARFKDGTGWEGVRSERGGNPEKSGFLYLIR